jgi:hypothetical protein
MLLCGGYYIFTVLLLLMKGGLHHTSWIGIRSCGFGSWVLLLLHLAVSIYWSYYTALQIIEEAKATPEASDRKVDIRE